jgi:hypothetical protein
MIDRDFFKDTSLYGIDKDHNGGAIAEIWTDWKYFLLDQEWIS